MHKGGYNPFCKGFGEMPSEPSFLPNARHAFAIVAYPAKAMT